MEKLTEGDQIALILVRGFEIQVKHGDTQGFDRSAQFLGVHRFHDDQVGLFGGDLFGTGAAIQHDLGIVGRVNQGDEVACSLVGGA